MSFWSLVLKNLLRQPIRAGLALLGIAVGITTVVALGVIGEGLKASAGDIVTIGGANFMVAQEGTADLTFSSVSEEDWAAIDQVEGVAQTRGVLFYITRGGSNPFFALLGARAEDLAAIPPANLQGRTIAPGTTDEIMLGTEAANDLGAAIGDTVSVADREFTVVGIYETGVLWENNGAYAALSLVQELSGRRGVVTVVYVFTEAGTDPTQVAGRIEELFPNMAAIEGVGDYGEVDQGIQVIDAANLAISLLAVGIGAIGVMNTMVMSVFERTRESGILRAVGWSGGRVMRMVLYESLLLCVAAAVVGSILGVVATWAITFVPAIRSLLEPQYTVEVFVRALVVAVVVALFGAAYPAYRAVRLTPMEALRYE